MGGRGVIGTVGRVVTLDNSSRPSTEGGGAPSGGEGRKGRTRGDRRGEVCSCDSGFLAPSLSSACPLKATHPHLNAHL